MDTFVLLVSFVYGKAYPGLGFRAIGAGSSALRRGGISDKLSPLGRKLFRPLLLGEDCLDGNA